MSDRVGPAHSPAPSRVELHLGADELEVHKRCQGADGAAALRAEAAWLAAARGAGVATLVGLVHDGADGGSPTLVTRSAGPVDLGAGTQPPASAAASLIEVAATLARLHDLGLVHGAVDPDHVVLGLDGRPALISPAAADRSDASGCAVTAADDLVGLGRCVEHLLWRWDDLAVEVPRRDDWERASEQLLGGAVSSARRARQLLAGLERAPAHRREPAGGVATLARSMAMLAAVAAIGTFALHSLVPTRADDPPPATLIATGAGPVLRFDPTCAGPAAATLDGEGIVWVFDALDEGSRGRPVGADDEVSRLELDGCELLALDATGKRVVLANETVTSGG